MKFKAYIDNIEFLESVKIDIDPSIPQIPIILAGSKVHKIASPQELKQLVTQGLNKTLNQVDPLASRYAEKRYQFLVQKATVNGTDGLKLTIAIIPIEKNRGQEEIASPDHPMYDYYKKRDGKTGLKVYKKPKDAIEDIPADPNLAYRGISWEEWQNIRKTGYIQSRGQWNLGQEGYTLFGQIPSTALSYAHGFAPFQYKTSFNKPSVIISIPRNLTLTHKDDPRNIPDSELGIKGKLSKDHIKSVWMLAPYKTSQNSYVDLIIPYVPAWDNNNELKMMGFYKLDPNHARFGSGNMAGVESYTIRKLQ